MHTMVALLEVTSTGQYMQLFTLIYCKIGNIITFFFFFLRNWKDGAGFQVRALMKDKKIDPALIELPVIFKMHNTSKLYI